MRLRLFLLICSVFFFYSCDKIFLGVEGKEADLQGKWQMDNVDTVYYNFQNNLFQYQIYLKKDSISGVSGYYTMQGDSFGNTLSLVAVGVNGYYIMRGDSIELRLLRIYAKFPLDYLRWDTLPGPYENDTICKSFKIEKLTSKKLILSSEDEDISFHKF